MVLKVTNPIKPVDLVVNWLKNINYQMINTTKAAKYHQGETKVCPDIEKIRLTW